MKEVRRLRLEKGWNQNELAFHAELAASVISLVETGRRDPNATTLRKLAEALGVEIPDLFERSDSPKAQAPSPEPEQGRRSPVPARHAGTFEGVLETYGSLRDRILQFDELPPEERKEVYQLTTGLRQLVLDSKDALPKPGAALLLDALTHAVLFFIGIYELEWERSSNEAAPPEPAELEAAKRSREEMKEELKAATERISA